MATAMRPFGQRLFADEIVSLRSFRVKSLPSSPPSLKASSLKVAQPFASILRSKRINTTTAEDISQEFEVAKGGTDMGSPPSAPRNSTQSSARNTDSRTGTDQNSAERPRTKSRIVRLFTIKFNSRSTSTPSHVRRPSSRLPAVTNTYTKQQRDAALRERGLLAPLESNRDLSQQEKEQDKRIPIVPSERVEPATPADEPEAMMSAADRVKREWEAKNSNVELAQQERLQSFKFGVASSSSPASPVEEMAPTSAAIMPVAEASNAVDVSRESESSTPSQIVPSDSKLSPSPGGSLKASTRATTPILDMPLTSEMAGYLFPSLPSSPAPSNDSLKSPASALLPSSVSVQSTACQSGACTPKPLHTPVTAITPTPRMPAISLTPPPTSTKQPDSSADETPNCHVRIDSSPLEESVSSVATPSLDSTSRTTTNSTLNTSESTASAEKEKLGKPQLKTTEQSHNNPVITGNPVEETFSRGFIAETIMEEEPPKTEEEAASVSPPQTQQRGLTDPTHAKGKPDRRKSLNPFKRAQGTAEVSDKSSPKRSVSSSFSSMRRSVVGTLSRKTNLQINVNGSKKFNVSHLPPSPAIPIDRPQTPPPTSPRSSTFLDRSRSPPPTSPRSPSFLNRPRSSASSSPPSPTFQRQAVAPIIYNRGSILLETCNIEDEESRRMTELAFLG